MRSVTNGKWGNLNSTGNEVSTIRNVTTGSKINTTVFTKQYASEENFKNIKSPSIIHIATHGFSSPQPKQNNKSDYFLTGTQKNIFQKSIDPLTRSGLIMSGGNEMWQKGVPYPNHEDEILTAKEVSEMDLGGCVLATLSACETGLGDVKGSEGVFGLQRAFKMAGVHYLIVSLWKVPDIETADFMQTFYSKWLKDKNEIKDAFRITQLEMSYKYNEPNKWAGFVLLE
jgi:CHAT domain-containing protein